MRVTFDIYQFCPDDQIISHLADSACEYCLHVQNMPDFLRINLLTFVAEDGAARYHSQLWQLRKGVDDAFSDPIAEIFHIRIITGVRKRQDGKRSDGFARLPPVRLSLSSARFRSAARLVRSLTSLLLAAPEALKFFLKLLPMFQTLQVAEHFLRGLITLLTVFAQHLGDDPLESLWNFGREQRKRRRLSF